MLLVHAHELEFHELPGRRAADPFPGHGDVSVRVVRVDPGPRSPHRHPRSVEVIHVLAGRGRHRQGDEERPVAPGDLVLVPAGVPHCTWPSPGRRSSSCASSPIPT